MNIPDNLLNLIFGQAKLEYPHECCGMIMENHKTGKLRIRPCENAQNRYHAIDPVNFPRTSGTAYFIDAKELLAINKELRENGEKIRIIYHSHIDAGAYFSDEDVRVALSEGEPAYPGVDYLVVSVVKREIKESNLFGWDDKNKKFKNLKVESKS